MAAPNPIEALSAAEKRFTARAVRRRRSFLALCIASLAAAAFLSVYYAYMRWSDPAYPIGVRMALVLLILLNARQNLRQYRYAGVLAKVLRSGGGHDAVGGAGPENP